MVIIVAVVYCLWKRLLAPVTILGQSGIACKKVLFGSLHSSRFHLLQAKRGKRARTCTRALGKKDQKVGAGFCSFLPNALARLPRLA